MHTWLMERVGELAGIIVVVEIGVAISAFCALRGGSRHDFREGLDGLQVERSLPLTRSGKDDDLTLCTLMPSW